MTLRQVSENLISNRLAQALQPSGRMSSSPIFSRVMLATDFSVPGLHAATAARQLATAFGGQVTLAHAVAEAGPLSEPEADEALATLQVERFANMEGVERLVVKNDRAAYGICEAAKTRKSDLIVAGRHGEHGLADRFIGSTTERIARHAPCSVYVCHPARHEQPVMIKHIIAATDLSEYAEPAVTTAAALAVKFGAWVSLVHVYDLVPAVELLQEPYELHPDHSFQTILGDKLEKVRAKHLDGIPADTTVVRNKSTTAALCDLASNKEADLIVLGTHGLTGVTRFLLGSVAERVIRHAPCSVLVVR